TLFEEFTANLAPVADRFSALRLPSLEAAATFADGSLDAVFIDAAHEFAAVAADLEAWYPKVKRGGWFCGHDYSIAWPGVVRAVDRFFTRRAGELLSRGDEFCWVSRKA
ncbi:MAG: class I SAM-dependent methyltransferase, partial [Planctomycetes bacterium]|nr:class I SAM-dependent methyltransferase [Planctomycetota bacterium]